MDVDGWKIDGINKGSGKFEFLITSTANGVTLSNEIIEDDLRYNRIEFYINNDDGFCYLFNKGEPYYYHYAYVSEAMDLSQTDRKEVTDHEGGTVNMTYHVDLNFYKPGWYKIINDDNPIKDDPKHSSGKNTTMWSTLKYE
jgi:hypothetical protein